jgi:predicted PurR-regulated permease PerM
MLNLTSLQKQAMLWFGVGIGALVLLYVLAPVLTPFLFAAMLGYLLNPGVDWLERHRIPRTLGVLAMVAMLGVLFVLLLLVVLPVIQREVGLVIERLPGWLQRLDKQLSPLFHQVFEVDLQFDSAALLALVQEKLGGTSLMSALFGWLRSGWGALLSVIANLFLVPIVLFYLLLDWHALLRRIEGGIPRSMLSSVLEMVREIDLLLSQFLRGQLLVMTVLAIYYSGAMALAGFDTALPVGILTGLLVFIPYVGFGLGLTLALLSAALQFGNLYGFAAVALIYGLGQFLESFWLTPRLVGERIGLHPLAVIFALLAFGELFGFFGVLLALPASAALLVALRRVRSQYLKSDFYRQTRR